MRESTSTLAAGECPPQSKVILVSSLQRILAAELAQPDTVRVPLDSTALEAARAEERARCTKACEEMGLELLRWWGDGPSNAACQECAAAAISNLK